MFLKEVHVITRNTLQIRWWQNLPWRYCLHTTWIY